MEKSLVKDFFGIVGRYRLRFAAAFFMILVSNGLLLLNPLIFREALMALHVQADLPTNSWMSFFQSLFGSHFYSVWPWSLLLLGLTLISACLKYYMRLLFFSVSREVEREVRSKIFERIQAQSRVFFDRHGIGDLLSRLTNDITAYRDVLGPGFILPIYFITLIIPALILLFTLSPLMTAISTLPIILIYLLNLVLHRPLYTLSQKVQDSLAKMSSMVHEHYSGIRTIKSYVIENETLQQFQSLCLNFSSLNLRLSCFQGMFTPIFNLVAKLVILGLVLFAAFVILLNWGKLTLADFLSFMWIQSYIFGPLMMLGWVLPMYQRGKASYSRLVEIYEEPIEVYGNINALTHIPPQAGLVFNHLTFSYPNQQKPALDDINLCLQGGSFIGITGPVGSGKTTLFRLLTRDYEIPEGMIAIGGEDIHVYHLDAFHKEIVTVEQIPFLFSKSIADNVRFGKHEATQEELEVVTKQADLHDAILDFPEQYDTIVGERGVSLSGGQKQRVAMARAFLVNRSILLLDDIFSAVDVETEKRIFEAMKKNFEGKTLLLITHRISILEQMDRVIYLMEGRVVEDGSPQELAKQKGPYAALFDLQHMASTSKD